MSKRKTSCKLLIVCVKSEINEIACHKVIEFVPSDAERLLLDLQHNFSCFNPAYDRGPHATYALSSYFVKKYGFRQLWKNKDPLDSDRENEESDEEVAAFLRNRRLARKTTYDWILKAPFCEPDNYLVHDLIENYVKHCKKEAAQPVLLCGEDLHTRIGALDISKDFALPDE